MSERRVAGIVLAAGASSRMRGINKMLLTVDGEPLVRRACRQAIAAGLDPVVTVTGHESDRIRHALHALPCIVTRNPDYAGPTSGSLHTGIEALPHDVDALVIVLADMVDVTTEMLQALLARAGDARLVVSRYGDVVAPPLLFHRTLFSELLAWHGEGCGKAVVRRHQAAACYVDWDVERLVDVDTVDEWEAWKRAQAEQRR